MAEEPALIIRHKKRTKKGGEMLWMADILQQMIDADVIVLASPVYFYSIDAQMKALIDRTLARWTEVKNKEFYLWAMDDREKALNGNLTV